MSQYSSTKREPILFPKTSEDFKKSIFSLKQEINALIADNPTNRDFYIQAAVEVAIDLQSALADWVLAKMVSKKEIATASNDLLVFAKELGSIDAVASAEKEIAAIATSSIKKMCDMYNEGSINTVWGHDYASGLDYSLRRGARWVTSNPCKIQLFKKDFPDYYAELIAEIKQENPGSSSYDLAAQMFTKVCAISARALRPIFEATNKEYGFVCMQVDPRDIKDSIKMETQVEFWYEAMKKELNVEEANVVFKLPAVESAIPAAEHLLAKGFKLCMTLSFTVTQHMEFAKILSKSSKSGYLVCMAGQLDDKIAEELESLNIENAKEVATHGSEAVMRKSYHLLAEKGYKNLSIMSAAVRGPWHIQNSMAPVGGSPFLITTVTGKINEFDANPTPISSLIDQPTEDKYMKLLQKSKVFNQAYCTPEEGLLSWNDLYEYPPFVGFYTSFVAAYQEIEDDFK